MPLKNWQKYKQKNTTSGDCQLVSAFNSHYFLTGKTISDFEYDYLIDECKCSYGSCIEIEKAWDYLGIEIKQTFHHTTILCKEFYHLLLPLEANVWHPKYGYHSVLIVDYEPITDCFRITNFRHETSTEGWIFRENFHPFISPVKETLDDPTTIRNKIPEKYPFHREIYSFRQFGLKN